MLFRSLIIEKQVLLANSLIIGSLGKLCGSTSFIGLLATILEYCASLLSCGISLGLQMRQLLGQNNNPSLTA